MLESNNGYAQTKYLHAFINFLRWQGEIENNYFQCTVKSGKITSAYTCFQKSTIQNTCLFNKYNNPYKNDKLNRLITT